MQRLALYCNHLSANQATSNVQSEPTQLPKKLKKPSGVLTQDLIDLLDEKLEKLKEFATLDPKNSWKLDSDKKGIRVHTRDDAETGCRWVRGETIVSTTPIDIVERVLYADKSQTGHNQYDSTTEGNKRIERINGYSFSYSLGKKPGLFISPRDTLVCNHWVEENGVIYCVGTSATHPDCPEREGVIRAHVILWGYILTPLPKDPNFTNVVYVLATDVKGILPKAIVNWFVTEQGFGVGRIRDWIALNPKK